MVSSVDQENRSSFPVVYESHLRATGIQIFGRQCSVSLEGQSNTGFALEYAVLALQRIQGTEPGPVNLKIIFCRRLYSKRKNKRISGSMFLGWSLASQGLGLAVCSWNWLTGFAANTHHGRLQKERRGTSHLDVLWILKNQWK